MVILTNIIYLDKLVNLTNSTVGTATFRSGPQNDSLGLESLEAISIRGCADGFGMAGDSRVGECDRAVVSFRAQVKEQIDAEAIYTLRTGPLYLAS